MTKSTDPAKDTIYVDVDDDITQVVDKVENANQKVVALMLPKRAVTFQSIVNMRLLKRAADNAGKSVVLITAEDALLPLAGAAGLHVAKDLQSKPAIPAGPQVPKQPAAPTPKSAASASKPADNEELPTKIDYGQAVGELAAAHEVDNAETIELGEEEDPVESAAKSTEKVAKPKRLKQKGIKVPNFDKFRLMLGLGVVGFIALIIFIVLALKVWPKATIAIETASTPVSTNMTLTADGAAKSVDETKNILPAFSKTSDQTASQQVTATGQQNNGDKATGSVTMSAGACSLDVPSDVPSGTGISSSGLTFITQKTASFSAVTSGTKCFWQSNSVGVTAQSGGANYNLAAGTTFNVAGRSSVSASNGSAFTGGTDNIQTIVSQSDIDNAASKLKTSSSDSFSKDFENKLGQQGYYVLASTLKIGDPQTSANPAVGQPASNTTVSIKITYTVLCVKKDDLVKIISDKLKKQFDSSKQKVQATDIINGADITVVSQGSPTQATLSVTETAAAVPILDQAALKKQIKGKKSGDITTIITNIQGVQSVKVKFSPFWVSKAPSSPSKIIITTHHVSGSNGG